MEAHDRFQVTPALINKQASEEAKRLMSYLCDMYGKRILTGQQIGVATTPELEVIRSATGSYPAVCGFDMMNYSPSRVERGSVGTDVALALDWWKSGGIVTFCWHWNAPEALIDEQPDKPWNRGFYTEATTFDVAAALADPESPAYGLLIRDIDYISEQLKPLQEANVPVLWRPLHEASGAWFWWGAKGPEACMALWKLMYERMTSVHGLHNLIWVWNGQHQDWYPGDEWVDMIGEDIYAPERDYSAQTSRFAQALSYTESNKIVALSENGVLPDPDQMIASGCIWAWCCTWYGSFIYERREDGSPAYAETHTELAMLKKLYEHPLSITRDELPDLRTYPAAF